MIDSVEPTDYAATLATEAEIFFIEEVSIEGVAEKLGPYEVGATYGSNDSRLPDEGGVNVYLPFMIVPW